MGAELTYTYVPVHPRAKTGENNARVVLLPKIIMFPGGTIKYWSNDYYIRLPRKYGKYFELIRRHGIEYTVLLILDPKMDLGKDFIEQYFDVIVEKDEEEPK